MSIPATLNLFTYLFRHRPRRVRIFGKVCRDTHRRAVRIRKIQITSRETKRERLRKWCEACEANPWLPNLLRYL